MAKYKRKPITVEAERITGEMLISDDPSKVLPRGARLAARRWHPAAKRLDSFAIYVGEVKAEIGDWVVTDKSGRHHVYPDVVFRESFEEAI